MGHEYFEKKLYFLPGINNDQSLIEIAFHLQSLILIYGIDFAA